MTPKEICLMYGHDWVVIHGGFWDTAKCATCEFKIRDILIHRSQLPNPRKEIVNLNLAE